MEFSEPGDLQQPLRTIVLPRGREGALLLILLGLGYSRIINTYFLADDFSLILAVVGKDGQPNWSMFIHNLMAGQHMESFRPLVTFFHVLGYALWGVAPAGYHLLNLLFHFLNSLLLYTLVATLTPLPSRLLPFMVAALFITYPLHPEAVTYIGSLPGLACATFYLLTLVLYIQYCFKRYWLLLFLSLMAFACALGTKEEAISLPFAIGLIALGFLQWPLQVRPLLRLLWHSLLYGLELALYFAHRWYIFGHVTPPYFNSGASQLRSIIRDIGLYLSRLAVPINFVYTEPFGHLLAIAMMMPLTCIILLTMYWRPPKIRIMLFCCLGFLVFLIPLSKVLVFGIDAGLTNSRYGYFPSIAFVSGLAALLFSGKKDHTVRPIDRLVVVTILCIQLGVLVVNNKAWVQASALMQFLQHTSRYLTGNRIDIEVVNIPDTLKGVLFNRGGFQRSLIYPFVPDNTLHHREHLVTIASPNGEALQIEGAFAEPDVLRWKLDHVEQTIPGMLRHQVRVVFQPQEARAYEGEILVRSSRCNDYVMKIPVRGHGTTAGPFPTYLAAVVLPSPTVSGSMAPLTYMVAVADAADGIAAEGVSIALYPQIPWRLQYFPLNTDGTREAANTPIRIPDGGTKHFVLEIMPTESARDELLTLNIAGLNTPPVQAIHGRTTIEMSRKQDALPLTAEPSARYNGHTPTEETPPTVACSNVTVSSPQVDFGFVPTSPSILPPQPFSHLGQTPALLFWDNLGERLVPFSDAAKASILLHASGSDLMQWHRSARFAGFQSAPTIVALTADAGAQFVESPETHILATSVAYFVVRMRIGNASIPYAILWWKSNNEEGYTRWASVLTVPDGYWHTYAIPLHAEPTWRSTGIIQQLRFEPIASSGWVEMASLDLIGPLP